MKPSWTSVLLASAFAAIAALAVSSCANQTGRTINLADLPNCHVTTSDLAAEHFEESKVEPRWDYVRSKVITERIRILRTQPDHGLIVLSSSIDDILPGDLIIEAYRIFVDTFSKYFDVLELNVTRRATLTILRDGTKRTIAIPNDPCRYYSSGRIERAFYNELYAGRSVNLLVLPAHVTVDGTGSDFALESVFQRRLGSDPRMAIALYGIVGFDNFRIIENRNLDSVLKELELKQLGVLEASSAIRIGRIVGANFLAETTHQFTGNGRTITQLTTIKKVYDLERGIVVGVDTVTLSPKK
jgi:hypothetical protein